MMKKSLRLGFRRSGLNTDVCLTLALAAGAFAIPFVLYWHELFSGQTIVSVDGLGLFYSFQYLQNLLREGSFPIWNPYLAGGMPQGIMVGAPGLYPLNWIVALAPVGLQMYFYFALHLAIGGAFMYRYLRKISCAQVVAFAVSVMYVFTIHMGGMRKEHTSLILSALYIPVILYFAEEYLTKRKVGWLFGCAGAMALQFLGGFLQYVIYSDIAVFFYLLAGGLSRKIPWKQMLKHGVVWFFSYFGMIMGVVLGTAQFMLLLSNQGGQAMEFENFITYSMHPVKILMLIFPQVFGNEVLMPFFDQNYSSGVDIELLLGAAAVSLLVASIWLCKKKFHVRYMMGLLVVSFLYACLGNIEILGQIIYRIPVLNMFRVPSRTLFLFTFAALVLIACSLNALLKENDHFKRVHATNLCVASGMCVVALLYQAGLIVTDGEGLPPGDVLGRPFLLFVIYLVIFYGLWFLRCRGYGKETWRCAVPVVVMLLMVIQVMPYYRNADISSVEGAMAIPEEIVQQVGTQKVWSPDGSCWELVSNSAQVYGIQGMNAYTNFNLGNFYKYCIGTTEAPANYSGLYNSFGNTESILKDKNDLISKLGVKYLMLSPERDPRNFTEKEVVDELETILRGDSAVWTVAPDYQIAAWPVSLEPNQYYQITFSVQAQNAGESFYVDFAAAGYDNSAQEQWCVTTDEEQQYSILLPSGDCGQVEGIQFRIVALTLNPIEVTDISVKHVNVSETGVYQFVSSNGTYNIYENLNAKDLFYVPERVTAIPEEEVSQLYTRTNDFDILNTSHLTGYGGQDREFLPSVEISAIKLRNNSATAQVSSEEDCFVNFSQTHYPGWKAYVDGKETEVYEVNGLIQGIFVPAGTHTIQFKFVPVPFYVGCIVSLLTVAGWIGYLIYDRKKTREQEGPQAETAEQADVQRDPEG